MAPFDFKSNKHFVASSDGATLQVHELTKTTLTNPASIHQTHWKQVASINTNLDGNNNDDEDDDDDETTYDGLLFFDGHGKIEGRVALTKLAQHLNRLSLMVSPGGYCFLDVNELVEYTDFGIHYLRLNDLFSWPRYKVSLAATSSWGRSEWKYHDPIQEQRRKNVGGGSKVSMEKYEELKKAKREKEEELVKLKEEMEDELQNQRDVKEAQLQDLREAKDEELRKLRKDKDEELRKLSKKKDDELKMLRKGKDGGAVLQKKEEELQKLRKEKEEELEILRKEKDDELEKLEKEKDEEISKVLEEHDNELQKVKKEKDEEVQRVVKKKDEELKKLRKEGKSDHGTVPQILIKLRKEKAEELQKLRREKDEEIETLRREKDEEIERATKKNEDEKDIKGNLSKYSDKEVEEMKKEKDDEVVKLRDQLSATVAELTSVKQATGQTLKSSSVVLPGGRVLRGLSNDEEWAFHVNRRRHVPPETFWCFVESYNHVGVPVFYLPQLTEARLNSVFGVYNEVDDGGFNEELLFPRMVHTETRNQGDFDVNNWWYTKTTHPEGGTTLMAYYDGDRYCYHNNRWGTIRIPYPKGGSFNANRNFYLANFCGKIRFCFTFKEYV